MRTPIFFETPGTYRFRLLVGFFKYAKPYWSPGMKIDVVTDVKEYTIHVKEKPVKEPKKIRFIEISTPQIVNVGTPVLSAFKLHQGSEELKHVGVKIALKSAPTKCIDVLVDGRRETLCVGQEKLIDLHRLPTCAERTVTMKFTPTVPGNYTFSVAAGEIVVEKPKPPRPGPRAPRPPIAFVSFTGPNMERKLEVVEESTIGAKAQILLGCYPENIVSYRYRILMGWWLGKRYVKKLVREGEVTFMPDERKKVLEFKIKAPSICELDPTCRHVNEVVNLIFCVNEVGEKWVCDSFTVIVWRKEYKPKPKKPTPPPKAPSPPPPKPKPPTPRPVPPRVPI